MATTETPVPMVCCVHEGACAADTPHCSVRCARRQGLSRMRFQGLPRDQCGRALPVSRSHRKARLSSNQAH